MNFLRQSLFLFRKDLRIELRKKESLVSMAFFGFLVLVILNVALGAGRRVSPEAGAGILWVAVVFSAVLGLGRVFAREKENGCLAALLVSPISPGALFVAKTLVNFALMALSEVLLVPAFYILFGQGLAANIPGLLPSLLLVNVGFSTLGTLLSALTSGTRRNEVLLPILLFPLTLPLVVLAVKATGEALSGRPISEFQAHLETMAAFGLIYSAAGYLLFSFAVQEG